MAAVKYIDFDLMIERSGKSSYRARVLGSPAGQAVGVFKLPFSDLELENFLLRVSRTRRGVRRFESPEMEAVKVFGGRLFKSIFKDQLYSALSTSLNEAKKQDLGLRIRLRLNDSPELVDLPWEYLYNASLNRFLCLSVTTPLIRYLELPELITPLTITPPLRMLVMISSPVDYPKLDVEREWQNLKSALSGLEQQGLLVLDRLEEASPVALQYRLRRNSYHIFHFIGHGGFNELAQDGVLLLENEYGDGRPISGQYLGTILHDQNTLRLVVLNACEGARSGRSDPFNGVAQSVVQQGIPAVIAMQFEVTDEAAITFAREFYTAIAESLPVDEAVTEARKAIYALGNDIEWGTPVLYMRSPDGQVFNLDQTLTPKPSVVQHLPPIISSPDLDPHYIDGLGAYWVRDWSTAWEHFKQVVAIDPNYKDAAAKLTEVEKQLILAKLYEEAENFIGESNWTAAVKALEELASKAPDYRDVSTKIEEVRKQAQLSELYAQAQQLHQAKQWKAVLNIFNQIHSLQENYPDPVGLLPSAQAAAREFERKEKLQELYREAVDAMEGGRWMEAGQRLAEVQALEPNYREVSRLTQRVQGEIKKEYNERQRRAQIAAGYEEAIRLAQANKWQEVQAKINEVRSLDPEFEDREKLAEKALQEITRQKAEAHQKEILAKQYAEAVRLMEGNEYARALEMWNKIHEQDPAYPDPQKVQSTALKKLASASKVTTTSLPQPKTEIKPKIVQAIPVVPDEKGVKRHRNNFLLGGLLVVIMTLVIIAVRSVANPPRGSTPTTQSTASLEQFTTKDPDISAGVTFEPNNTPETSVPLETGIPLKTFTSQDPNTFLYAQVGEPETFDPALDYESTGQAVLMNVYETLVFYKREKPGEFVPLLATEIPTQANGGISADGKTYTFNIRPGIMFHSGNELKPSDIAFSLQRGLLQGGTASPQWLLAEPFFGIGAYDVTGLIDPSGALNDDPEALAAVDTASLKAACQKVMDAIQANDNAGTLTLTLAQPWAPFIATLSKPLGAAMEKKWVVDNGGWDGSCDTWQNFYGIQAKDSPFTDKMNGTGPFKLDHWTKGKEIVLTRNDAYWRTEPLYEGAPTGPARLKNVVIKRADEWSTRFAMLQAGDADTADVEVDVYPEVDPWVGEQCLYKNDEQSFGPCTVSEKPEAPLRLWKGAPSFTHQDMFMTFNINTEGGNPYIGSGMLDGEGIPPDFFSDIHVRKAFGYCFDWDTFIQEAFIGEAIQVGGILMPGMPGYDPDAPIYTYDPRKCEEEFKASEQKSVDGKSLWDTGFRIRVAYNTGNTTRQTVAEILQKNIAAINGKFVIEIIGLPFSDFIRDQREYRLPIFITGWIEDIHDPHNWYVPYLTGSYAHRQRMPEDFIQQFQNLIDQGVSEIDSARRAAIYTDLDQMVYDQAPVIFLATPSKRFYVQRWVEGFYRNPIENSLYYYDLSKQ